MGKISGYLMKKWKLILNVVTFVALLATIYIIRKDLISTFSNLHNARARVLLLLIPIEILNYHAQTKMYQHLFRTVGNKLSYRYLYLASLELNFVNHVFPSGGAAGISYFGLKFRDRGITAAKATTVQIMKLAITFISFVVLIFLSVFFLALKGRENSFTILIAGIFSTLLIVSAVFFLYITGKKERINTFFIFISKTINRFLIFIKSTDRDTINIKKARVVFEDFHQSLNKFKNKKQQIKAPLMYALVANSTEIAAVYVVFVAFGHLVNVGAVILAYGIANFAGSISILPGGVGIYEALMTAVLLSTGIPPSVSLPIIITYRVLNTILQIPPGYYLYQRHLAHSRLQPKEG